MGAGSSIGRLTKEEVAMYKREFEAVDKDKSGTLTQDELVEVNVRMGYSKETALIRAKEMISLADTSKDGIVSWAEYLAVYEKQKMETGDLYEAIAEDIDDHFSAAKASTLSKDATLAALHSLVEANKIPIGVGNASRYRIQHEPEGQLYTAKAVKDIIRDVLFPTTHESGAGATA